MRIAITGATGFIGRHVVRELSGRGWDVVATFRRELTLGQMPPGVTPVKMDLAEFGADPFEQLGRPDVLVHLAWEGLPNYGSPDHIEVERPRQEAFLLACLRGGLRQLLVTGTCQEYGMREGELHEDFRSEPTTSYSRAKALLLDSLMLERTRQNFGLAWLRVFYLYGSGQAPSSLYSQLQAALDRGDAGFPMSPGDQSRDFMPVQEAAFIIADLAARRVDAGIVNLCSGVPTRVLSLVQRWIAERGAETVPMPGSFPYPSHEPFSFWGSRARLDRLLENPDAV